MHLITPYLITFWGLILLMQQSARCPTTDTFPSFFFPRNAPIWPGSLTFCRFRPIVNCAKICCHKLWWQLQACFASINILKTLNPKKQHCFALVCRYLYTSEVSISTANLAGFLVLARLWELPMLTELCCTWARTVQCGDLAWPKAAPELQKELAEAVPPTAAALLEAIDGGASDPSVLALYKVYSHRAKPQSRRDSWAISRRCMVGSRSCQGGGYWSGL